MHVTLDGKLVDMEIDTGTSVSLTRECLHSVVAWEELRLPERPHRSRGKC